MVECMYGRNYQQGSYIIKQGEPGNHIFVLAGGFHRFFQLPYNKYFAYSLMIFANIYKNSKQSVLFVKNVTDWAHEIVILI